MTPAAVSAPSPTNPEHWRITLPNRMALAGLAAGALWGVGLVLTILPDPYLILVGLVMGACLGGGLLYVGGSLLSWLPRRFVLHRVGAAVAGFLWVLPAPYLLVYEVLPIDLDEPLRLPLLYPLSAALLAAIGTAWAAELTARQYPSVTGPTVDPSGPTEGW
ncbi:MULTISPECIES: hypothetical protein [unclassified Kitasatospora]|uniref:hypothetical protein n=1 Tax=unclassified Kitasatospora TaxID=2633591 RepID=UPI000A5EEBF4|nr:MULTISPECIES: hypothetical protein [unclassified Kitasatospora]